MFSSMASIVVSCHYSHNAWGAHEQYFFTRKIERPDIPHNGSRNLFPLFILFVSSLTGHVLLKGEWETMRQQHKWISVWLCNHINRLRTCFKSHAWVVIHWRCGICSALLHTKCRAWRMNACMFWTEHLVQPLWVTMGKPIQHWKKCFRKTINYFFLHGLK